jgi:hypothetical protein
MSRCVELGPRRFCKPAIAAFLSLAIVWACTGADNRPDPGVGADTSRSGGLSAAGSGAASRGEVPVETLPVGGLPVAHPAAGSAGEGGTWIIRERARIGRTDGSGPDVFGRVAALAIGSDGVVHVFDGFARQLRSFDLDGRLIAVRGRRGGGPNEFEGVVGMSLAPDESLWLVDAGNGRYARLQPDGAFETVRRPIATYELPWLGGWDAQRGFYDQASALIENRYTPVLVRMAQPGTPGDTLRLPAILLRQPGLGSMSFPLPFAPRQLWAFDPAGRIWTGLNTRYELTAINFAGDTVAVVRRGRERLRLGPAQRDSVSRYVRSLTGRFGVQVSDDMIPEAAPLIQWISIDDRGFLWVCATGLSPCGTVDVFAPHGAYQGAFALPVPASGAVVVRGNTIAFAALGPDDTPMVIIGFIAGRDSL